MQRIVGHLVDAEKRSFANHVVVASYEERFTIAGTNGSEDVWKASKQRVDVAANGDFTLDLPDADRIRGLLTLVIQAPGSEVLGQESYDTEKLPEAFSIKIAPKESFAVAPSSDPYHGRLLKLVGRVLDASGKQQIANKQVVLWARTDDDDPETFAPVLTARTDGLGYFSGEYPRGTYAQAFGVVAVGDSEHIPLRLETGAFPGKILLVVDAPPEEPAEDDDDCGCHTSDAPRAPDSVDLITNPSAYSDDLVGGECVRFTTPNRTLEEYSYYSIVRTTEPEIKGLTLTEPRLIPSETIAKLIGYQTTSNDAITPLLNAAGVPATSTDASDNTPGFSAMSLNPAVLKTLASDPDRFSVEGLRSTLLTAQSHSAYLDVKQALEIYTKNVAGRSELGSDNPVDWDDEPTFYQATTVAHGHLLHFKQVWKADGYSLGDLLYSLPLAPGQKKQIAVVSWHRRELAARSENLLETEQVAAQLSRDRDISEIVQANLRENTEGGSSANTWAAGGGIGLALGPVLIGAGGGGGGASSHAWQRSARNTSAFSLQQLRDHTMQSAAAVRSQRATVVQTLQQGETMQIETEVVANHNHCHAVTMEYFEVLRHFQVSQELVDVQECLFVPLLMSKFDAYKALRWREPLQQALRDRSLSGAFDALERITNSYQGSDFPLYRYADEALEDLDGELRISFSIIRPPDKDNDFDPAPWQIVSILTGRPVNYWYDVYLKGQVEKDRIFREQIAPRIAEAFVQKLSFTLISPDGTETPIPLDATLVSNYVDNAPLVVSIRSLGSVPAVKRANIAYLRISTGQSLPGTSKALVQLASLRYRTAYMSHYLVRDSRVMNDLSTTDSVTLATALDWIEERNPRKEDRELARKLISHLNEHVEHYHTAIWLRMNPERRYMLLDGFVAPNANGRSVASVVENRLIGVVGNCLVMPVARGFKLDPSYEVDAETPADLIDHYAPTTPIQPMRISVPTNGVFAEAVMGSCNSCELKDDARFWKWEESPNPDEPTAINTIGTDSRVTPTPNLTPKDFPTPIINIQNVPNAPDPTGLAAAFQLLAKPDLFKDITGLEQNQKNALAAFNAVMGASTFFGGEAAKLAQQRMMTRDIDKTLQAIQKAERAGLIDHDKANKLANSALQGMLGQKRQPQTKLTDHPEVRKLIDSASDSPSSDVNVKSGNEKLRVKLNSPPEEGSGGSFDYNVPGVVAVLAQPTNNTCWATVSTMLVSWRDQASHTIEQVMDTIGAPFDKKFKNNQALASSEKDDLLVALGLVGEPPMSYLPRGILDLLQKYGPLWVTTDEDPSKKFSIHARIVTGMYGDGSPDGTFLRITDPAGGRQYNESFATFARKFEEEARDSSPDTPLRIQIVHFPSGR